MLLVTEFDPIESDPNEVCANFHIGFGSGLDGEQERLLQDWWILISEAPNNQGGCFDYRADGGGENLENYIAKDRDRKKGRKVWVKLPPHWIPDSVRLRLWFCIGSGRGRASDGARFRKERKLPRRAKPDSVQRKSEAELRGCLERVSDSTQRITSITSVDESDEPKIVVSSDPDSGLLYPFKAAFKAPENMCQVCWTRWGRALWDTSCKCTGAVF